MTLAELEAVAPTTITATTHTSQGVTTHTFTGVPLFALLERVGLPSVQEQASTVVSVSVFFASDGHWVTFSEGELDPQLGAERVLVAYQEDGHLLGTNGMAELVVPGDRRDDRWVPGISNITVFDYTQRLAQLRAPYGTPTPVAGSAVWITGFVQTELTVTPADLRAMPATTITVTQQTAHGPQTHRFTGVPLADLVLNRAGLRLPPNSERDRFGMSISVLGGGAAVTLAEGELDPALGHAPVLVAYQRDGRPLGADQLPPLVVAGDRGSGRSVVPITRIDVYYPFPPIHG